MNRLTRGYYRLKTAKVTIASYQKIKNFVFFDFMKEIQFFYIKKIFILYCQYLRDLLREQNIKEFYPKKIIKSAIENNLISSTEDVWLEYIDMLNIYFNNNLFHNINTIKKIITIYKPHIDNVIEFMNSEYDNYDVYNIIVPQKPNLPKECPKYSPQDIGISENSYELLIDFFIKNPKIKYVWLFGSRVDETARFSSDIDLLIDFPLKNFNKLKEQMNKIEIPYRIDAKSIYYKIRPDFVNITSQNSKIIYRSEDFIVCK